MHKSMALKYVLISSHHSLRIIKSLPGFWSGGHLVWARNRDLSRTTPVKREAYGETTEVSWKQSAVGTQGLESHQESECPMLSAIFASWLSLPTDDLL